MKIMMDESAMASLPELDEKGGLDQVAEIMDLVQENIPEDEFRKMKRAGVRLGHC